MNVKALRLEGGELLVLLEVGAENMMTVLDLFKSGVQFARRYPS